MTARPAGLGARPPCHRARVSAGLIGASVPGPGRAPGEAIAAAIVSGSVTGQFPASIQDAGHPWVPA
jgi:ABC-type phosphate transport system permease subunit